MQALHVIGAAIRRLRGRTAGARAWPAATDLGIRLVEMPLNDITQQVMRADSRRRVPTRQPAAEKPLDPSSAD